jgi:hypothetical protein
MKNNMLITMILTLSPLQACKTVYKDPNLSNTLPAIHYENENEYLRSMMTLDKISRGNQVFINDKIFLADKFDQIMDTIKIDNYHLIIHRDTIKKRSIYVFTSK